MILIFLLNKLKPNNLFNIIIKLPFSSAFPTNLLSFSWWLRGLNLEICGRTRPALCSSVSGTASEWRCTAVSATIKYSPTVISLAPFNAGFSDSMTSVEILCLRLPLSIANEVSILYLDFGLGHRFWLVIRLSVCFFCWLFGNPFIFESWLFLMHWLIFQVLDQDFIYPLDVYNFGIVFKFMSMLKQVIFKDLCFFSDCWLIHLSS